MPIEILASSFQRHRKTFKKFELITRAQKPTFKNDYECVDFALSVLQCSFTTPLEAFPNDLEQTCKGLTKSSIDSEELRNLGNMAFKSGNLFEAHRAYTLSIAFARPGSKELALAYANRSAVLLEKQYFKECLEDIQRALENNYPQEKKTKLLQRRAKAQELLPTQKKILFHDSVPAIKKRNPNISSASECIKINKNEQFGRHMVANRTIKPGEILLVEKPYSQFVFPEVRTYYCSACLEVCWNMIPCEKCSGVLYCTKACRRKAYIDYHQYECAILLHFGFDIINWNATRLTLKGIKEYDKEDTDPNVYRSDRYKEFSELISHKSNQVDSILVFRAAGVAKVFYALKKFTDIFTVFDVDNKENALKTLLFNDTCMDQSNSFSVKKYDILPFTVDFGRAIYSTLSLFNHACYENVGHSFYGSTVVLRARKEIKKGEQCFVNYGVNPFTETKRERQQYIKDNFYFICKCQGCAENWPKEAVLGPETFHLMPHFLAVHAEVCFGNSLDENRKMALLQKVFQVSQKLESIAPYLAYGYCNDLFDRIFVGGNICIPF